MWSVYVIQHDESKCLYFGISSNLKRRLNEHNKGEQFATKRKSGHWVLIYCEIYKSKIDAANREHRLKHHGRAKQELLKRISNSMIME